MGAHIKRFSSIFHEKTEAVFLLLLSLYTYVAILNDSLLNISAFTRLLRYAVAVLCIALFIYRNRAEFAAKKMVFASVVLAAFVFAARATGRYYLILYAVLIITAEGCNPDKAVKAWLFSTVLALLTILVLCAVSVLPDYYGDGKARHFLGFPFYSYFPFLVFYCLIAYIYGKKDQVRFYHYILAALVNTLIYYLTALYLTFYLTFFFIFLDFLLVKNKNLGLNKKPILVLSGLVFPLGVLVTFFVMVKYNPDDEIWLALNTILHRRPEMMHQGFLRYPINLFGNSINMLGHRALRTIPPGAYFYIDSGFAYSLLGYGLVFTVVVVALYSILCVYSCRTNNKHLFAWLVSVLAFSMMNNTWVDIYYNPVLLFSFAAFREFDKWEDHNRVLLAAIEAAGLAVIAAWLIPWLRTLGDAPIGGNPRTAILTSILMGLLLLGLVFSLGGLVSKLLRHQQPGKRQLIWTGALLGCCACGVLTLNGQLNRLTARNIEKLESERLAIETVQQLGSCQLLVDGPSEVYRRAFGGVGRSFYHGNSLTALSNVAYITGVENNLQPLIRKGYKYTEISKEHAIYTNSPEAESALMEAGYHLTGFYSHESALDLNAVSRASFGEPLPEDTAMDLLAAGAAACSMPLKLNVSPYQVTYELALCLEPETARPEPDEVIARVKVVKEGGTDITAEKKVCFSDFDLEGHCSTLLDFVISDADGVKFVIEPPMKRGKALSRLLLLGIRYRENPVYDTHAYYDVNGRVFWEDFYDLNGNPITIEDGSHAREYGYDRYGNVTFTRYLDQNNNLAVNLNGYAEIRRQFNQKQQLVNEAYFDDLGKPVNIGVGYASVTSEYDELGRLTLQYYFDTEGNPAPCGSSYFHDYLATLAAEKNATIFLSIKDEGTSALTPLLLEDLRDMGLQTELAGKFRYSYYAVIGKGTLLEEISANRPVSCSGVVDGVEYSIASAGFEVGNNSSIVINGIECSRNTRGMNIVVVRDGIVVDSVAFDTCSPVMVVTK